MPIESLSTEPNPDPKAIMMYEPAENQKGRILEVRDWRTSKYPLRLIIRGIFITYMWSGMWQVMNHLECKKRRRI